MTIKKAFLEVQRTFDTQLATVRTEQEIEAVRISFLGRKGRLAQLMKLLAQVSTEEKKEFGPKINQWKQTAHSHIQDKLKELKQTKSYQKQIDVTAYRPHQPHGSLHIYSRLIAQLENIFISMGFAVEDGPEVETDYYNFTALNIPDKHPARDMHDTFWLDVPGLLLRTHTSTIQVHAMEKYHVPLAIFAPGRCYRNEATDATHEFMFYQGECLVIDTDISIANLLATAKGFLQDFFEKEDIVLRVRPGYFPFVEPGLEIDASCPFCKTGCSICKKTGWIELLGAGLVHPNVLQCSGIDPEKYSGFAFGFGLERLAMIKYAIDDIRLFHRGSLSFLEQFSTLH
jgi:phenylalanyl-tRNA synthetase alpha chain